MKDPRLGKLKDIIKANTVEIIIFVCLFLLISAGAYYTFFIPNSIMPPDGQNNRIYFFIGLSIIITGILMALIYIRKLWGSKIEIYEFGMIIYKGNSKRIIPNEDIGYFEWHEERGRTKGIIYYRNKILLIYNKEGKYITQADSLTFRNLEKKINTLNLDSKRKKKRTKNTGV